MFQFIITSLGSLILFPFAFIGFTFAWITFALIGILVFVGFPLSAICMDSVRWFQNNFRTKIPENELSVHRLKKASRVMIIIFRILSDDIRPSETRTVENDLVERLMV